MQRSEQLKILLDHPNTEHIQVDEAHKVNFVVDYKIDSLKWLLDHGDSLKAYYTHQDIEPHAIGLYNIDGSKSFYVNIKTAPMYKWIVGRKNIYCEGALKYAEWIDPFVLDAPIDGALLAQETIRYVENYCQKHKMPFKNNGTSLNTTVSAFQYDGLCSEIIGWSKTDEYTHVWCIAPETPF